MAIDPRPIANALLDGADRRQLTLTNLSLNKILFFAHADYLMLQGEPLISLSFEAWEFGPVVPLIYHQFKHFESRPIAGRATRISPETGEDEFFDYDSSRIDVSYLNDVLTRYGEMSASALVALSHMPGGPWHRVWHANSAKKIGMTIPNKLIVESYLTVGGGTNREKYVH